MRSPRIIGYAENRGQTDRPNRSSLVQAAVNATGPWLHLSSLARFDSARAGPCAATVQPRPCILIESERTDYVVVKRLLPASARVLVVHGPAAGST